MSKQNYKILLISSLKRNRDFSEEEQLELSDGCITEDGHFCLILAQLDEDPGFHTDETVVIDNFRLGDQVFRIKGRVSKRQKWLMLLDKSAGGEDTISTHIVIEADAREAAVQISRLYKEIHPGVFVG